MLYEVSGMARDENGEELWQEQIVDAPAHVGGVVPAELIRWVEELWAPASGVWEWTIAEYVPARVGFGRPGRPARSIALLHGER